MDGGGRRSPRLVAIGKESTERVQKRNSRSVSPPPPAQTGVKVRPRREPVRSGKGASQGTVVGPGLAKTDRDRAAGVEEELVDLPAWSGEEEDKEETMTRLTHCYPPYTVLLYSTYHIYYIIHYDITMGQSGHWVKRKDCLFLKSDPMTRLYSVTNRARPRAVVGRDLQQRFCKETVGLEN